MAYTVKQLAAMSGVSVRTLHFYDETGLLEPAYCGANGYRFYEQQQLLTLQQILFYRELGFELKQIKRVLGRADFEVVSALLAHRKVLKKNFTRTRRLLHTIDKTVKHLKGSTRMSAEEMFRGFKVAAGEARFAEQIAINGEPIACKVSSQDTNGAMCVFEITGTTGNSCGPRHAHHDQDEWIYIIDGEFDFEIGEQLMRARTGETVFLLRRIAHAWAAVDRPGRILNTYQPAGKMEEFYREVSRFISPPIHEVLGIEGLSTLFKTHGMDLMGAGLRGKWSVDEHGRIHQLE